MTDDKPGLMSPTLAGHVRDALQRAERREAERITAEVLADLQRARCAFQLRTIMLHLRGHL